LLEPHRLATTITCASPLNALVFTGASQFAVVGVLSAGGCVLAALAPALLLAALAGALIALVLMPVTPAGVPIIASALGVVPGIAMLRRRAAEAPA
jgi:predicted branched-subunit amino acid permease